MATIKFNNVSALYPKLDRTYRFDQNEQRSVPCDPLEDGAEYTINFEMTEEQYKNLTKECEAAWEEFRKVEKKAPAQPMYLPHKVDADGKYVGKAKLKGAYKGEATKKPIQVDADNSPMEDGFQLTTGSTINVMASVKPYKAGATNGVGLRLIGVQVIDLLERESPFEKVEFGYKKPSASEKDIAMNMQRPTSANDWVENGGDEVPF